jgi:hypothetical protein
VKNGGGLHWNSPFYKVKNGVITNAYLRGQAGANGLVFASWFDESINGSFKMGRGYLLATLVFMLAFSGAPKTEASSTAFVSPLVCRAIVDQVNQMTENRFGVRLNSIVWNKQLTVLGMMDAVNTAKDAKVLKASEANNEIARKRAEADQVVAQKKEAELHAKWDVDFYETIKGEIKAGLSSLQTKTAQLHAELGFWGRNFPYLTSLFRVLTFRKGVIHQHWSWTKAKKDIKWAEHDAKNTEASLEVAQKGWEEAKAELTTTMDFVQSRFPRQLRNMARARHKEAKEDLERAQAEFRQEFAKLSEAEKMEVRDLIQTYIQIHSEIYSELVRFNRDLQWLRLKSGVAISDFNHSGFHFQGTGLFGRFTKADLVRLEYDLAEFSKAVSRIEESSQKIDGIIDPQQFPALAETLNGILGLSLAFNVPTSGSVLRSKQQREEIALAVTDARIRIEALVKRIDETNIIISKTEAEIIDQIAGMAVRGEIEVPGITEPFRIDSSAPSQYRPNLEDPFRP